MSKAGRRQPLSVFDSESVKRSSTSGIEGRGVDLQSLGKSTLSSHLALLSTPETRPSGLLKGRLYPSKALVSCRERQSRQSVGLEGDSPLTRGSTEDLYVGFASPGLEPHSAITKEDISVVSVGFIGCEGDSQWGTPQKVNRRKRVEIRGMHQKDLSTSLIIGGQLQRDEATLLYLKKVAQRKEMQEALRAQIAEKQRHRRIEELLRGNNRHSQPTSMFQSPRTGDKQDGYDSCDLSPVLSGSTEDQELRNHFPDRPSDPDPLIRLKEVPKEATRRRRQVTYQGSTSMDNEADDQFRRLRYAASISPVRNAFGLERKSTLEDYSQFIYPSEEGESTPGVDEIDRFLKQQDSVPFATSPDAKEPQSPERGRYSEQGQDKLRSFPRHIFGGRSFRKANKRFL